MSSAPNGEERREEERNEGEPGAQHTPSVGTEVPVFLKREMTKEEYVQELKNIILKECESIDSVNVAKAWLKPSNNNEISELRQTIAELSENKEGREKPEAAEEGAATAANDEAVEEEAEAAEEGGNDNADEAGSDSDPSSSSSE